VETDEVLKCWELFNVSILEAIKWQTAGNSCALPAIETPEDSHKNNREPSKS